MDIEYTRTTEEEKTESFDFDSFNKDCNEILRCISDFEIPEKKSSKNFSKESTDSLSKKQEGKFVPFKGERNLSDDLSFLLNNQEFTKTKRYGKFVQAAYDAISDIVFEQVWSTDGGDLFDFCRSIIIAWTAAAVYSEEKGGETEMQTLAKKSALENLAAPFSNLSGLVAADMWVANAAAMNSVDDKYKILKTFVSTCYSKEYTEVISNALCMVCYEHIYETAIKQGGFNESNWYNKVKEIDRTTAFLMLAKLLKYTLRDMEGIVSTYVMQRDNENIKIAVQFAADMQEDNQARRALEEQLDAVSDELKQKNRQISILRGNLNKAQSIETAPKPDKELEEKLLVLQKENNRLKVEKQEMEDKYQSMQEFLDCLSKKENSPDASPLNVDFNVISCKRIVFIRDIEAANYTMMSDLATKFPNARFTNYIASDINAKTTDLVVLLTRYICHGTYWGAKGFAKTQEIPCIHSNYTNVEKIAEDIAKAFS